MRDPWNDSELAARFQSHSETAFGRAPLNAALSRVIARRPNLFGLLGHAPRTQQLPVLLLAAIHFLVLDEPEHELARWYPNLTGEPRNPDDPQLAATLEAFVDDRASSVIEIVATRHTQTNEVGRCALLLPAFALVAREVGPLTHIDIGTSAGLNLALPQFGYRYDDGPVIGDADSTVQLHCGTRGVPPLDLDSMILPDVTASCGIDARPIEVADPVQAKWLEACCWPDQADRFHRLRAAIEITRNMSPDVITGDAVGALRPAIERLSSLGHPVITTTWVLNYLEPARRTAFLAELDQIAATTDLSWVSAESPALTPELPHAEDSTGEHLTALDLVTWRQGRRVVAHLAHAHPHGYWAHWR